MIKIRYAELPDGLHAQAERCGRQTIIHLAPGLSAPQRHEALGRLIRTSRRGHGPRLRSPGVSLAVARDVTRATMRNSLAAVRCHPAGALLLAAVLASAVVCYTLFVSVSIRMVPHPGHPQLPAAAPPVRDSATPLPRASGTGPATGGPERGRPWPGSPSADAHRSPSPGAAHPVPSPGGEAPSPSPEASSPADPAPTASPSPGSAHPSPGNPGGLCVGVGPLGICLSR